MLSTVLPGHPVASKPLLLSLVLAACGQAPMLLGGCGRPFPSHFPWAMGERLVRTGGARGSPSREKKGVFPYAKMSANGT